VAEEAKTKGGAPGYDHNKRAPEDVQRMFNAIAPGYDRLNRIVSFGLDLGWRRDVAHETWAVECEQILDVCSGTGDLAIELCRFWKGQAHIDAVDFSKEVVEIGKKKVANLGMSEYIQLVEGDAMNLPFEDDTFDALTIGFGFRNIQDREKALREFLRVVKPGGLFVCLEVTQPAKVIKPFYYFYMMKMVPEIAHLMGQDMMAYKYLGESIKAFPGVEKFTKFINSTGWTEVTSQKLGLGSVAIHTAFKPVTE
jgi:demethylmenaquinone methyltransferase / 2-methoxy-6-polyprenyl-1,4-benzoquinol methylase